MEVPKFKLVKNFSVVEGIISNNFLIYQGKEIQYVSLQTKSVYPWESTYDIVIKKDIFEKMKAMNVQELLRKVQKIPSQQPDTYDRNKVHTFFDISDIIELGIAAAMQKSSDVQQANPPH